MSRKNSLLRQHKKSPSFSEKYPVKYYIGTIPIRDYNVISVYLSERDMARIAQIALDTDLSVAKIMAFSGKPCDCCKDQPIVCVYKGQSLLIPRGLMTIPKMDSGCIITHNHWRTHEQSA